MILVHKGKLVWPHLQSEHLRESELRALLRKQGIHSLHEIHTAILEPDGTPSVTKVLESAT